MSPATIVVLPDTVIDQIAAGEVIERPASVVKELVENSLDAGATHIAIEVEAGGKRLVRVVDDGHGMAAGEVELALLRHATSKIRRVEDLVGLATMGFRGEALPSIAAVSRLTITCRTRTEVAGTRVAVEGGRVVEVAQVGVPVGTVVEVRDLLYNLPARLKFLKGDATEAAHITEVVSKLAMAHADVHVRLRHGPRKTIDAPPHVDGFERAQALLGARLGGKMHRAEGEEHGVRVVAYLAAPELAQSTSRGAQLFVARRPVRDRGLLHALGLGYGELLPRGRYPVAVLFLDVPADALDVNVHPQKLEVRFADAQKVYAAVRHTVSRAVAEAPWLAEAAAIGSAPVRMHAIASDAPPLRASDVAAGYAVQTERTLFGGPAAVPSWRLPPAVRASETYPIEPRPSEEPPPRADEAGSMPAAGTGAVETMAAATVGPTGFFSSLSYIGQLDRTYLLAEAGGELVLIDQHAAHERVAFQRLRDRHAEASVPVQRLLFAERIELSAGEAAAWSEMREALVVAGFELEPFGDQSFALGAIPAGLRGAAPAVLRELLAELAEHGGSRAVDERLDAVFATIACHSVVRAGDTLTRPEAEALLAALDGVDFKAHCPHGRPVLLRISVSEIARRFGRT
jgi:DNA mismatch repair protein MutL